LHHRREWRELPADLMMPMAAVTDGSGAPA
jgi:hypothetical protein